MSFPKYGEYKQTGVEGLESIPAEWQTRKLKYVCEYRTSNVDKKSIDGQTQVKLCNYTDVYYNDEISTDLEFMTATASDEQIAKFTLTAGDVIITKDSETADDIAVAAYVPDNMPGIICGYHLAIIRPRDHVVGRFLKRLFDSHYVKATVATRANGLTRVGLGHSAVGTLELPLPPLAEQQTIAAFLDRETAKIDRLVAEQRRLIELLKEKRQAVISHAVTKGLNPDVRMKPSGIEWIGDVPEHWEIKRLKHISPFISVGIVVEPSNYISENENDLPFIYGGDIRDGVIDFENCRRIRKADSDRQEKTQLCAGDVLTVRVGAPGETAVVPQECEGGNCASVMFMRRGDFDSRWLCHVMNSRVVRFQVEVVQYGAAQKQFNISHAVDFSLPVPSVNEQTTLAAVLDEKLGVLNRLYSESEKTIALLLERRTALISAAVTGKIDVRGWNSDREADA